KPGRRTVALERRRATSVSEARCLSRNGSAPGYRYCARNHSAISDRLCDSGWLRADRQLLARSIVTSQRGISTLDIKHDISLCDRRIDHHERCVALRLQLSAIPTYGLWRVPIS